MIQKYPIGIQHFTTIREENYLYVDKTEMIASLVQNAPYYFLSRPRRFGKSLLLSTLSAIFQGKKELFKGLWIEDKIEWIAYPIVHISFSSLGYKSLGLEQAIHQKLTEIATHYGLRLTQNDVGLRFRELLIGLSKERKVVVLIDEYDKPIIDYLTDITQARQNKEIIKRFYAVIKDSDEYIRFLMITGVSKFSKASLFSDLNNLNDITLDPNYVTLCGYTDQELSDYFDQEISNIAVKKAQEKNDHLATIKAWYNGYSWDGLHFVYNPFSVLSYFSKAVFQNFWFSTGTPTFLVDKLKEHNQFDFEQLEVSEYAFDSFELDRISPTTLLFQTGYLTIKHYDEKFDLYHLSYPNKEVKQSLINYLLASYSYVDTGHVKPFIAKIQQALAKHDYETLVGLFNSLFASIPHQIFLAKQEAYFHSIIFLSLHLLGYYIQSEVSHHKGRLDAVVQTSDTIFVIEFKLNQSATIALEQIKKQEYAKPYLAQTDKRVVLLGLNLNPDEKAIDDWKVEEII